MAFGDIGGAVTELVITCRTRSGGEIDIKKGDAVVLIGDYVVANDLGGMHDIFGEALESCIENNRAIPVKVRGISIFHFEETALTMEQSTGVVSSKVYGAVEATHAVTRGIILKVDHETPCVHVLL